VYELKRLISRYFTSPSGGTLDDDQLDRVSVADVERQYRPWSLMVRYRLCLTHQEPVPPTLPDIERATERAPWEVRSSTPAEKVPRLDAVSFAREIDQVHFRVVFALSVALALALGAVQCGIRLALVRWLGNAHLPVLSATLLSVGAAFGLLASFGIRSLAGRLWREEVHLTTLLVKAAAR
jgi:hypothetical protein